MAENPDARLLAVDVPAVAGSLAPNVQRSANDTVTLSWLEPTDAGHRLRFSVWLDSHWSAPTTVSEGSGWFANWADRPAVVATTAPLWSAHWLVRRPAGGYAYDVYHAVSQDSGKTWSEPKSPHRDNTDSEHGFVSHYATAKGAGLVWLDGRETTGHGAHSDRVAGMTLRGATLESGGQVTDEQLIDSLVCDCCPTDAIQTPDGPVTVYRNRTEAEVRDIYYSRQIDGVWQEGKPVANDGWVISGCPVNGPAIANKGNTVAVAWFTGAGDQPKVRFARTDAIADGFGTPVDVLTGDTLGRVGLVLMDDGTAIVSALQKSESGQAALVLHLLDATGARLSRIVVSDNVPALTIPQLTESGNELLIVWSDRGQAEQSVFARRLVLSPAVAGTGTETAHAGPAVMLRLGGQ
ncbi:MAG: sialidase family protein [Woeseia sp.]